jgi:hypothetical protein
MNKERELLREIYADLEYDSKLPLWLRDRVRDCLSSTSDDAEELELEEYDAGLLGYFGGGDVEWWQDYIRDLLGRAHDHYQSQVSAHTPKLAESDLCKALEDACAHVDSYGGMSNSYRLVLAKARGENHE